MPMLTLLLAALFAQASSPTPERPRRIILDVDPGIDDALAMFLAMRSPELRIEAVTVVSGNVIVDVGASNALKIVELAGREDLLVAKGGSRGAVRTTAARLDEPRRREEIARMLAGATVTDEARAAADRLILGAA